MSTMVTGVHVNNLSESIIASGLPMQTDYSEDSFMLGVKLVDRDVSEHRYENKCIFRAIKLGSAQKGSGHDNWLTGISVFMNVTATVKWWQQFQRYHFEQIVSSQSTMHRLRRMIEEGTIEFHPATDPVVIDKFMETVNKEDVTDATLAYSCPMGILMTAAVSTNYLQLKNIWHQRRGHKLPEWQVFCDWIETLPMFDVLTGIPVKKGDKENA